MPHSLLRWSIALFFTCLLLPMAPASGKTRKPSTTIPKKESPPKKTAGAKRLNRIPGGELLRKDAATAFERMYTAARAQGIWLRAISGHRTRAEQRRLYRRYRQGLGPRAARPGRSNHERGTAIDIRVKDTTTPAYAWLAANACSYGFRRTVRSEPWHWEYRPRSTRAPKPGQDCQGQPRVPAPTEGVARPSPS